MCSGKEGLTVRMGVSYQEIAGGLESRGASMAQRTPYRDLHLVTRLRSQTPENRPFSQLDSV